MSMTTAAPESAGYPLERARLTASASALSTPACNRTSKLVTTWLPLTGEVF